MKRLLTSQMDYSFGLNCPPIVHISYAGCGTFCILSANVCEGFLGFYLCPVEVLVMEYKI